MGKFSPIDLLRGLETNYDRIDADKLLDPLGLLYVWEPMKNDCGLWKNPFRDLCGKAGKIQLKDFIKNPSG